MRITLAGTRDELHNGVRVVRMLFQINGQSEIQNRVGADGKARLVITLDVTPLVDTDPAGYPNDRSEDPRPSRWAP
ncbi:hypothetical protein GCM10009765_44440 [Fodinicola feengrottensis]|uniref:Uncharacterized protein n=1 Tax=Fodinicola feengrottensis TaxID=435914 RepID=A0ABN2HM88_9ACTN